MNITIKQIAWLAGLLEGEAWFGFWTNGHQPIIELGMTDPDVVQQVADIFQTKMRGPIDRGFTPMGTKMKLWYETAAKGSRAVGLMMTIYPLMGSRRQTKIREILKEWREYVPHRAPDGCWLPSICHPNKPRSGNGLCQTCYMREYRKFGKSRGNPKWKDLRGTGTDRGVTKPCPISTTS